MSSNISKKEKGLIKGALRRVFSRSEIRKKTLAKIVVMHSDSKRKRVKTWYQCPTCEGFFAQHELQVDHILPIIRTNETLDSLSFDTLVDRIWCDENNLVAICKSCHSKKTSQERKERLLYKKGRKPTNER